MTKTDAYSDVVELCALLQCLGFGVKSLDTRDGNMSQEVSAKTITINCQASGLLVVMESTDASCSCPINANESNSGFWQVSGVAGGKQSNKESGSGILGSLPRAQRDRLTKELQDIIKFIKEHNETEADKPKEGNKSTSMIELKTPEKRHFQLKSETPARYRSLDTLTATEDGPQSLPAPGLLQRQLLNEHNDANIEKKVMCQRQSTYTLTSPLGSVRSRNKTSSPIQVQTSSNILESLIAAKKGAEEIQNKLAYAIRELCEEGKNDSSLSSLALDVSKISVLKGHDGKAQFSSSPNLSALANVHDDITKRLKRTESASTSNLVSKATAKDKQSRLRRISPNLFKFKKDNPPSIKIEKKCQDSKTSKFNSLFKPKGLTPSSTPKLNSEASPNLSASRKKFSHVKSTIPRPAPKKE
ncbi:unnamed protein product [Colias eurytheme]|nr:unnamed protein product [Colias eurytheme]